MQQTGFVKNSSVNISGKLPEELVARFTDIHNYAKELAIDFLVVGAMARDIVLVHGFGSKVERATNDVDFGIYVANWVEFGALRDSLIQAGYEQDANKIHRLTHKDKDGLVWEIDIVPFGKVADENNQINWPPTQDIVMNVLGYQEAFEHALDVQISVVPDITISVASPAGLCLLKLVSWLDRVIELRAKDATDLSYLIQNYSKIPEVFDALYEGEYMAAQEWDDHKASAMKLGEEVALIASLDTTKFLKEDLFHHPDMTEQLARDMQKLDGKSLARCKEWLEIFEKSFLGGQHS